MACFIKLVYLLIVLSIAADLFSLGGNLFNTGSYSTAVQSSLLHPGAEAAPVAPVVVVGGILLREAAKTLTKSAIKAAKKRAKQQAKKAGNARNKAKKAGGNGT